MAIAFRTAQSQENVGGAPVQEAFTTLSGDTHLIVGCATRTGSGSIDAVTFNSVSMTLAGSVAESGYDMYFYYLINPDVGTYNITFTLNDATNISYAAAAYTGAPALAPLAVGTNSTASGASLTTSNTAPTGWNVLVARANKGGGTTLSAGTGSTSRSVSTNSDGSVGIFDSNAQVSGAQSMAVSATASSLIVGVMATIPNTSINITTDTNTTTDSITGTGNIWYKDVSDTNVSTDASDTDYGFGTSRKSTTSWTTTPKS